MKRNVTILAGLLFVMIAGSVMTSNMGFSVPVILQTADPSGSYFAAPPGQALSFIALTGFLLFNLIGMGATIAFLLWYLNGQVKVVENIPTRSEQESADDALPGTS